MEELGSLWGYQENIDELNQKLLYTNIELESMKMEANEALKMHKEEVKHLLNLLKVAYEERDEAKAQLQKLLNINEFQPNLLHHNHIQNSSITESNSHSHGSSPVDSFFDAVSSPDFSNVADSGNMGGGGGFAVNQPFDSLVKGKILPQKGKLLQTVMDSGPLLHTLLVAGPLPRWRNPPPALQPFKIPLFSIKPPPNSSSVPHNSQMCSTSILNFASCPSGSGVNAQIPSGKRQRFQ